MSRNNYWIEARGVVHNEESYYLYDGRGSVTANTWYNGMVTDVYQYDPYGQVTLGSTKHTEFYGYNAESYNPNTGLEYLRARYYNPNKGRFFQEDSYLGEISDPLTLNRYAYTKNSPLNYMDPSGFVLEVVEKLDAFVEGDHAHKILQAFLSGLSNGLIETEYNVRNHPFNKSMKGRADIVYHGPFGDEVYEIKPGSYSKPGTLLNELGKVQRLAYIIGMEETFVETFGTPFSTPPVYREGATLNALVEGLILPDMFVEDVYIKYYVYPEQTGMIYYYYGISDPGKEYQEALDMAMEAMEIYLSLCYQKEGVNSPIQVPNVTTYPSIELPDFDPQIAEAGAVTGIALYLLYMLGLILA